MYTYKCFLDIKYHVHLYSQSLVSTPCEAVSTARSIMCGAMETISKTSEKNTYIHLLHQTKNICSIRTYKCINFYNFWMMVLLFVFTSATLQPSKTDRSETATRHSWASKVISYHTDGDIKTASELEWNFRQPFSAATKH